MTRHKQDVELAGLLPAKEDVSDLNVHKGEYGMDLIFRELLGTIRVLLSWPLRCPVIVIWLAVFGGALHTPALPFFYTAIGLSPFQFGVTKAVVNLGSLFTTPVHGYLMDKTWLEGNALVVAVSFCGFGCLLRALASGFGTALASSAALAFSGNFITLTQAFISSHTPSRDRALYLGTFNFTWKLLSISGKGSYPMWARIVEDWFGVREDLKRYRVTMMLCGIPCLLGFFVLIRWATLGGGSHVPIIVTPRSTPSSAHNYWALGRLAAALMVKSLAASLSLTIWPLFLSRYYGFTDINYASVVFTSSFLSAIAVLGSSVLPLRSTAMASCTIAAFCLVMAFVWKWNTWVHCALGVVGFASVELLGQCLNVAFSILSSQRTQGLSFGMISVSDALGGIAGNLGGSGLYQFGVDHTTHGVLGGAIPFLMTGLLLFVSLLSICTLDKSMNFRSHCS